MVYVVTMLALALVVAAVVADQTPAPAASSPARLPTAAAVVDPAVVDVPVVPPLPGDEELQRLAASDIAAARATLRRAARTSPSSSTRALALRLLATNDAGSATARICGRALRVDVDPLVRRAGAECLGRLGTRFGAPQTPALVAALGDPALDVVTMAGWALAAVGDAGAIGAVAARASHHDPRVAALFRGYAGRLKDRFGLSPPPMNAPPTVGAVRSGDAVPSPTTGTTGPSADASAPTAVPPGVALTFPARSVDSAAATGWLGLYGAMAGWLHGSLLVAAHGGPAGAQVGPLAGMGMSALGATAMTGYAFTSADSMPQAQTVVQFGTLGTVVGYGAGQLVGFPPVSAVASANLSAVGTLVGTGLGMAFVAHNEPTMGALAAGVAATLMTGAAGGALTSSYGYPFNQTLGAALVTGGIAGAATTTLLARSDIGLFPVAGATLCGLVLGGGGALVMAAVEPGLAAGRPQSEATGWVVLSSIALGAALGGAAGMFAPADVDPFRAGTLRLQPPTVAFVPGQGVRPDATPVAVLSGSFG
jgi:hypothetical protein